MSGKPTKKQLAALDLCGRCFAGQLHGGGGRWCGLDTEYVPNKEPVPQGPWDDPVPPGETTEPIEWAENETIMELLALGWLEPIYPSDTPWREPLKLSKEGKMQLRLWR